MLDAPYAFDARGARRGARIALALCPPSLRVSMPFAMMPLSNISRHVATMV